MFYRGRISVVVTGLTLLASLAAADQSPRPGPASGLVRLPSGITLHYAEQGAPRGPAIVMLHGIGDSWHSYELVLPHIPADFHVYAVSLRGHGLSDKPAAGYTPRDFAADLVLFLDAMDLRDVTLVGHSLGSFVAQAVVERGTPRVGRLALVGAAPGGVLQNEAVRKEVQKLFASVQDPIDEAFARDFQASTVVRPIPAPFFETMCDELRRAPARLFHGVAAAFDTLDARRTMGAIAVPTRLFWGDRDELMVRADQDALLAGIAGARLTVYTGSSHSLHWEEPERFAKDLVAFIRGR